MVISGVWKGRGILFSLGLMGGVISILVCIRQVDLKCFIAYSSVAHIGLVIGSLSLGYALSVVGGI